MTREEINAAKRRHFASEGLSGACGYCVTDQYPCASARAFDDARRYLDLREEMAKTARALELDESEARDRGDLSAADTVERVIAELRALTAPKPTTEKGASDGSR
jgi:hypothetical protein